MFGDLTQRERQFGRTENADPATAVFGRGNIIRFGRLSFGEMPVFPGEIKQRYDGAANVVRARRKKAQLG